MPAERNKERVLAVVELIPVGRVTTYGAIGRRLGLTARHVARVMSLLKRGECENWFRVVGASGLVSTMKLGAVGRRQIARLRAEGVEVARTRVLDFDTMMWEPG